jgi:hypothetical protein
MPKPLRVYRRFVMYAVILVYLRPGVFDQTSVYFYRIIIVVYQQGGKCRSGETTAIYTEVFVHGIKSLHTADSPPG